MENQIILLDSEKDAVIEFHRNKILTCQEKITELQNEIAKSAIRITELNGEQEKYDLTFPLWRKVYYVLKTQENALTTKEIAREICTLEFRDESDQKDIISAISATLKPKIDRQEIFGRSLIGSDHYYGLIDWFDEVGDLKSDYFLI